jgi:hypothetical protein
MPLTLLEILSQHFAGGGVQGYPPILTKLTAADRQHPGLQIDVVELEVTRFAEAKTRDAEQSKKTVVDQRQQRAGITVGTVWQERHVQRGVQELFDLPVGIEVRPGALWLERQEPRRWNLRARIECTSIARKLADVTGAARPMSRLRVRRLLRSGERQRLGDIAGTATFHEGGEVRQHSAGLLQLKAEATTRMARYSPIDCRRVFICIAGQC